MSKDGGFNGTIDPTGGWPRTTRSNAADGEPRFEMEAFLLSPERAKFGDAFMALLTFAGLAVIVAPLLTGGPGAENAGTAFGVWLGAMLLVYLLRPWWLGRRLKIMMSPERLLIGRKTYDRNLVEAFAASEIHERAQEEEIKDIEAQQEATMRGKKPVRSGKYYRKSHHLVMRYAGQRVDIASIYGRPRIGAGLRDRLELMNTMMSAAQAFGHGAVEDAPEARYGARPGID